MPEITCQQCGKRFTAATRRTRYCPDCARQRIRERARDQQRRSHGWTEAEIAAGCRLCADCGKPTGDPYRTYCPDCARQHTRKSIISRSRRQAGWTEAEIAAGRRAPKPPKPPKPPRLCALCGKPTGNSRRKYCPACQETLTRDLRRSDGWTEAEIAAGQRSYVCIICGKPRAIRHKYCPECAAKRAAARAVPAPSSLCVICGKPTGDPRRKYCPACKAARSKKPVKPPRLCALCGKPTGSQLRTYCPACAKLRTRESTRRCAHRQAGWTEAEIAAGRRAPKPPKPPHLRADRAKPTGDPRRSEKPVRPPHLCALCGKPTGDPRRTYCPDCARQRKKEDAKRCARRRAGWTEEEIAAGRRTHLCVLCGKPTSAANARYCPACAAKRAQEQREQGHRRAAEKAKAQAAARKLRADRIRAASAKPRGHSHDKQK